MADAMTQETDVLAWQICTGCASTREVPMQPSEVKRRMGLPMKDWEEHDGCYRLPGARYSRWITNGARVIPEVK